MSDLAAKEELTNEIEESAANIRKKYLLLREGEAQQQELSEKILKPILEPLKKLGSQVFVSNQNNSKELIRNMEKETEDENIIKDECDPMTFFDYLKKVQRHRTMWDNTYGINQRGNKFYLGDTSLLVKDNRIKINNKNFKLSDGLLELLFMKNPDLSIVKSDDKETYKEMLHMTNAHRYSNSIDSRIKGSRSIKYNKVIKRLFDEDGGYPFKEPGGYPFTLGKGMSTHSPKYEYWDNPNELVSRLRLLIASTHAGNNNHTNEISSLIEELRESNIIV